MEWLDALRGWVKISSQFAPAAVLAAVLAAFMPRRETSILGSVVGALLAAPVFGLLSLEWFPQHKASAQVAAVAGGVSVYWLVGQVPKAVIDLWGIVTERFRKEKK